MQLDKDHKFNFFKSPEKCLSVNTKIISIFSISSVVGLFVAITFSGNGVKSNQENLPLAKGAQMSGVLTAQNTFVNTSGQTFVISPHSSSFESVSQKEITPWVKNQEPSI